MAQKLETKIKDADGLLEVWSKATVSSPEWFQVVDCCIGALLRDNLERLQAEAKSRKPKRKTR